MLNKNTLWEDFSFFCEQLISVCNGEVDIFKIITDQNLRTNDELLKYCLENDKISVFLDKNSDLLISDLNSHSKSDSDAQFYIDEGTEHFDKKNYLEAAECFTISLSHSIDKISVNQNSQINISFANRAKCLFKLKDYKNCLNDSKNALNYGYTDKKFLEEIIFECESNLKNNYLDNKIIENNNGSNFNLNDLIENTSDKIQMEYDKNKGRKLIAIDLIEPGEKLIREQPFVTQLSSEFFYEFCNHCFVELKGYSVPCKYCNFYVYCSDECKSKSFELHKEECGIFSDLNNIVGIGYLVFKILFKQGVHNIIKTDLNSLKVSNKYLSDYNSVYNLLTHEDKFDLKENIMFTLASITFKHFLCKLKQIELNKDETFKICQFIMHHIQQFNTNLISIDHNIELKLDCGKNDINEFNLSLGVGLYPVISLLNHSCVPNVFPKFNGAYLEIISNRKIKVTDEILFCYGPSFNNSTRNDRRLKLKKQYFFDCNCEVCESKYENKQNAFLCQDCYGAVIEETDKTNYCLNCKKTNLKILIDLFNEGNVLLENGQSEFKEKKFENALELINKAYIKFIECLHRHNSRLRICIDLLIDCFIELQHYSVGEKYSLILLSLVKEIYGPKSVECLTISTRICNIKLLLVKNNEETVENLLCYIENIKEQFLPIEDEIKLKIKDFKGFEELNIIKLIEEKIKIK